MDNTLPPIKLGYYKHYKGKDYKVIGRATHSETLEPLVIYLALYDNNSMWARPEKMFFEHVIVDGKEVPRFAFVKE